MCIYLMAVLTGFGIVIVYGVLDEWLTRRHWERYRRKVLEGRGIVRRELVPGGDRGEVKVRRD